MKTYFKNYAKAYKLLRTGVPDKILVSKCETHDGYLKIEYINRCNPFAASIYAVPLAFELGRQRSLMSTLIAFAADKDIDGKHAAIAKTAM